MTVNKYAGGFTEFDQFQKAVEAKEIIVKENAIQVLKGSLAERVVSCEMSHTRVACLDKINNFLLTIFSKDYRAAKSVVSDRLFGFQCRYIAKTDANHSFLYKHILDRAIKNTSITNAHEMREIKRGVAHYTKQIPDDVAEAQVVRLKEKEKQENDKKPVNNEQPSVINKSANKEQPNEEAKLADNENKGEKTETQQPETKKGEVKKDEVKKEKVKEEVKEEVKDEEVKKPKTAESSVPAQKESETKGENKSNLINFFVKTVLNKLKNKKAEQKESEKKEPETQTNPEKQQAPTQEPAQKEPQTPTNQEPANRSTNEEPAKTLTSQDPAKTPTSQEPTKTPTNQEPVNIPTNQEPAKKAAEVKKEEKKLTLKQAQNEFAYTEAQYKACVNNVQNIPVELNKLFIELALKKFQIATQKVKIANNPTKVDVQAIANAIIGKLENEIKALEQKISERVSDKVEPKTVA